MNRDNPRIAIIGCGAVTELRHLPALRALGIKPALLVDKNFHRAESLAKVFDASQVSDEYTSWKSQFDAAIVALPHHLHAPVCIDLLSSGVHILAEKPLATTLGECNEIIKATEKGKTVLAVGLMRRFMPAAQWVKAIIDTEELGRIESFDFQEGSIYGWPMSTDFFLRKATAGGGVLLDTGAHTLDLLLWWLGDVTSFDYSDDSYGGVEADCRLHLTLANGAEGVVELSRARRLRNTAILRGQRGEIEVSLNKNLVVVRPQKILSRNRLKNEIASLEDFNQLFVLQIKDWLRAIKHAQMPLVSGIEASRSVALIEACYEQRHQLEFPWESAAQHYSGV